MPEAPDGTDARNWIMSAYEVVEAVAASPEHADPDLIADALTGIASSEDVRQLVNELKSDTTPSTGTLTSRPELRYRLLLAGAELPDQTEADLAGELPERRRRAIREQVGGGGSSERGQDQSQAGESGPG
ncbi:hypothetical protein [Halorussus sp. AFM4]|uniref:hypothetical protein n=1 Tax=Halorussus sp. AFM4 TaxID=3421651 RepID=UPI003EBF427C